MLLGVGQGEKKRNLSWREGRPGRRKSLGRKRFSRNDRELCMATRLKEE